MILLVAPVQPLPVCGKMKRWGGQSAAPGKIKTTKEKNMGCDGGYRLFKLSEMKRPEILRRIQNWFIVNTFENPFVGPHWDWVIEERRGWDNKRQDYESVTIVTLQDWLHRHGFNLVQ
jgi:hypothetical protein